MDNKEAIERLQRIDFERSNMRDRIAIHHAINTLKEVSQLETILDNHMRRVNDTLGASVYAKVLRYLLTGEEF